MDDNGLHNDFDDRDIRSGDSYDLLGYRKVGSGTKVATTYGKIYKGVMVLGLLFVIISGGIYLKYTLLSMPEELVKDMAEASKKAENERIAKLGNDCKEPGEDYVKNKYELTLPAVTSRYEDSRCKVTFKHDNKDFTVEYHPDDKNHMFDDYENEKIKDSFNKIINEELTTNFTVGYRFVYMNFEKNTLFGPLLKNDNYSDLFDPYYVIIYTFDDVNYMKIDSFMRKYHIKNLQIVKASKEVNNNVNPEKIVNTVRYVSSGYKYDKNMVVKYNYKNYVIKKEKLNEVTGNDYQDDLYITLELKNPSININGSFEYTDKNCYKLKTGGHDLSGSSIYFTTSSNKQINIKVDDKSIYANKGGTNYDIVSITKDEYDICIVK